MLARRNFAIWVVWMCVVAPTAEAQLFRSAPEVKDISAKELYQLMMKRTKLIAEATEQGGEAPQAEFVVIDVREPKEYQVSMLPGAITKAHYEQNVKSYKGVTVIPYCTVGGRSSVYAKQLASSGVKVLNFKESIIGWCNAKLPLVTADGKPTSQVHTYSSRNKVPAEYQAVH